MSLVKKIKNSRENQFFLLAVFLFVIGLFLANVEILSSSSGYGWVTFVFLLVSVLPVYYGLSKTVSKKKTIYIIVVLSMLAWLIEYVGLITGFPYGKFYYTNLAGPKIFGVLPLSVAFAWPPLVIGSYFLFKNENQLLQDIRPILFLVALDLVIDPGAVEFGLWGWLEGGLYYNVPFINYFGWFISASIGVWVLDKILGKNVEKTNLLLYFAVLVNLTFWSGFLLGSYMFVPFVISLVLIYQFYRKINS